MQPDPWPLAAKGIGELPIVGVAVAGVPLRELPITAERVPQESS
jgi:CO/xanthine dehydrogenase Mo-binding subunit